MENEKNKCTNIRTTTSATWTALRNKDQENIIFWQHQKLLKNTLWKCKKVEGKRARDRHRCGWEDNIRKWRGIQRACVHQQDKEITAITIPPTFVPKMANDDDHDDVGTVSLPSHTQDVIYSFYAILNYFTAKKDGLFPLLGFCCYLSPVCRFLRHCPLLSWNWWQLVVWREYMIIVIIIISLITISSYVYQIR